MNPYSPELNYYLAYQYCRSIGLQLASFETKEKSDSIMKYLSNAGTWIQTIMFYETIEIIYIERIFLIWSGNGK